MKTAANLGGNSENKVVALYYPAFETDNGDPWISAGSLDHTVTSYAHVYSVQPSDRWNPSSRNTATGEVFR